MPSRRSAAPAAFLPMIDPTLVDRPPAGAGWAHEIKWDGWRVQAQLAAGIATLYTRQANDCTQRFPAIAAAMAKLRATAVVLDGEAVAIDARGRPDFHAVLSAGDRVVYKVFDILQIDGVDLRPKPWRERKALLAKLLKRSKQPALSYVEAVEGDGDRVLEKACKLGLEGIVSKHVDSPYRAGRTVAWRKARCAVTETVAVVGFTGGRRLNGLHVARASNGNLVYAGRIEHGLDAKAVAQLEALLRPRVITTSPTFKGLAVTPGILVDISHRGVTEGGVMRHPRFERVRPETVSASSRRSSRPCPPSSRRRPPR